jgi:NAD(P)-dependent dehydrogenase (short-subunit alcohol dehydrogenase family)
MKGKEMQLDGQVIVVTGASSGLGTQLARATADAGGIPVLAARRADRLAPLTDEIPGADAVTCDVTDEADRRRLIDEVVARHGRIDGLINNAGAGATAPALRTSTETFARVLDLNLVAPFALSCLAAERIRESAGGRSIVFASEMTAELGDDPEQFPDFLLSRTPLRRGGRAGELDDAVIFLLGPGSSFVTGALLSVDGGMAVA